MKKEKIKPNKNNVPVGMIILMIILILVIGIALFNTFILSEI